MPMLDETHDPKRRSWVATANAPDAEFPLQNLPFAVFAPKGGTAAPRGGIGIGDSILDLAAAHRAGVFTGDAATAAQAAGESTLNRLMAMGKPARVALRKALSQMLGSEGEAAYRSPLEPHLVKLTDVELLLPAAIGDFTDFYTSIYHASTVGAMLRPDNPLLPNFKWIPVAYHSRSSSIVPSGTAVKRPMGQIRPPNSETPLFVPSRTLDYEVELGFYVGTGNALGATIPIDEAEDHIFGYSLLNDWSARDVQAWEYQPLGPFLAKSLATTVSPWVVTSEAMLPFRCPAFPRAEGDPAPLPYLASPRDQQEGGIDITVEVSIETARMRDAKAPPFLLGRCNPRDTYWTVAQMLAHHASNGCNLRPGDLLGTGTISGKDRDTLGCLLELSKRGAEPVALPDGETRRFVEDGDAIILRGRAERPGAIGIGFGEARGVILPAG